MGSVIRFNGQLLKFGGQVLNYLHPRTKALLDYASTQGYKAPTNIGALNTYIMKMDPILDKLDLFYLFTGDGDTNFKLLNIVNPEVYKGTAFGGLTWDNSGVKGNGVNGYVNTNFNPSLLVEGQKYQLNDASFGLVDSETSSNSPLFGDSTLIVWRHSNTFNRINSSLSGYVGIQNSTEGGLVVVNRESLEVSFDVQKSLKSVDYSEISSGLPSVTLKLMLLSGTFSNSKLSISFGGSSLTYEETQLIRTYTNEYLTKLNLNPIA